MGTLSWPELIILLVVVVLIFGTTRLAGLGKASGRAIREFKEETKAMREQNATPATSAAPTNPAVAPTPAQPQPSDYVQPVAEQPQPGMPGQPQPGQPIYDAEVVDPNRPATN